MKLKISQLLCYLFLALFFSVNSYGQDWEYEVKKGDNLWDIADEYMIDVLFYKRLQKLNNIKNPYLLQPGSTITAPVEWLGSLPGKANVIAKVGYVVIIKNNQKKIPPSPGYQIEPEDIIVSGKDGAATIEFSDGSILSVYPETSLKFNQLLQTLDGSVIKARLVVSHGRVDIDVSDDKLKGRRLEIESPSAITAVRGTVFRVGVDNQTSDTVTEVLSGTVDVTNTENNAQIAVASGLGSRTSTDQQSVPPLSLLEKPVLDKSTNTDSQIGSLGWKKLDGASYYRVRVATDEEFINTVYNKTTIENRADDIYFFQNGTHYVSVRASDINDIEGFDSVTTITVNAYPLPPIVTTPFISTISQNSAPVFNWQIIDAKVKKLKFQLAKDKNFESVVHEELMNSVKRFELKEKLDKGQYYWRVASIGKTNTGGYSNPAILNVE